MGSRRSSSPPVVFDTSDRNWHLDRKVPVSIIGAILIQTASAIWFASAVNERISRLEEKALASASQGDRLTRVEEKLEGVRDGISEIKSILRREQATPPKGGR